MTDAPLIHGSFTLNRDWAAPPARVFAAWADPAMKASWFRAPTPAWQEIRRSMEFRVGGIEIAEGRFADTGMTTLFTARYHVIQAPHRLVYAYDLHLSGALHSVTLASLHIAPRGAGTHVAYTEQIVFLTGQDGTASRREGTTFHIDEIGKILASA